MAVAAPVNGTYLSPNLGTDILNGRWSESFAGGGPGQIGNTVHAQSWDGSTLGTQWELAGPAVNAAPLMISDTRVGGTGAVTWYITCAGGTLTLDSAGPWGTPGDADYVFGVDTYNHTTTVTYQAGVPVASVTVVNMSATWQGDPNLRVSFLVALAVPADVTPYPDYIPSSVTVGAHGICQEIRMEIVPEPLTLALLAGGMACVAVRRRC